MISRIATSFSTLKAFAKMFAVASLLLVFSSCVWNDPSDTPDYLPLDDSEYPYANLPRVVIETEDFREIRDTETKIPARFQIYGKNKPESDVMFLTIKGRGTSSFKAMPKNSFKLEFDEKEAFFGMPKDKEWAVIANFADRTMLRNFATCRLSEWLGFDYSPKGQFVELYLNKNYMGIYLFSETIKAATNRVDIKKTPHSYLIEKTSYTQNGKNYVTTQNENLFRVRYPKNLDESTEKILIDHLDSTEEILGNESASLEQINSLISPKEFYLYYWMQEFAKNSDGAFHRSVFLNWTQGEPIKFGPIWDLDMGYGSNFYEKEISPYTGWLIKKSGWFQDILKRKTHWAEASLYWKENRNYFEQFVDSLDLYANIIRKATLNEFKRWDVLNNTEFWGYKEPYHNYDEALDSLKSWTRQRIRWIDANLN